jgi:cyclopropane fatty-acyl-phospholipid synthase-like methyltransferase
MTFQVDHMSLPDWDEAYRCTPPWDIGRPQPAIAALVTDGRIGPGRALDIGCGTGENAILLAQHGCTVAGIDLARDAIAAAQAKAAARHVDVEFVVGNALELDRHFGEGAFATVIDSGLFHVLTDEERPVYVKQVGRALKPGGRYFMMCFSDKEPPGYGPRRVSKREIETSFSPLFRIDSLTETFFESRLGGRKAYLLAATRA